MNHKGGLNGGPGNDVLVGDNYTKTGTTSGGGSDALQSGDGGDDNAKCKPGTCDDVFYGDNYSASCGDQRTVPAIDCQIGDTFGGGPDLLTTNQGNDLLVGGVPDNPGSCVGMATSARGGAATTWRHCASSSTRGRRVPAPRSLIAGPGAQKPRWEAQNPLLHWLAHAGRRRTL